MIQSPARVIETQGELIEAVSSLQRSHDSLNASLAAMEQSNDASFARVEQSLQRSHDSFNASLADMEQNSDESFARVEQPHYLQKLRFLLIQSLHFVF